MYESDHHLLDDEDHLQHALTKGNVRKGSVANHLLNFSRPVRNNDTTSFVRKKKGPPPRTRDEFLHANFRFVISPLAANESRALYDPDALTEWDKIEQVIVAHDATVDADHRCPICLDTLRAPKITRCGHAYCWHCILTYLSLTENYWRRCPMCFDAVKKHDLRSVLIDRHRTIPSVGSSATFRYVHRGRGSWFPHLPAPQAAPSSTTNHHPQQKGGIPSVHGANAVFSRILESTPSYLESMIQSEKEDLDALAAEAQSSGDDHALPVIQEALAYCEKRLAKLRGPSTAPDEPAPMTTAKATKKTSSPSEHEEEEAPYSFYQLDNGHAAILHPLCLRALTREFGSTHSFPHTITATVLEIEHMVVTDDVRRRFRYMAHLPSHCDLFLVEVDLSPVVSPATYSHFYSDIKKRARGRQAKRHPHHDKKPQPRSDSFDMSLMLQLALDNDDHYPHLQDTAASDDKPSRRLDDEGATGDYSSPYASFANVTTNQGYYPSFNADGDDRRPAAAAAPGWPNVNGSMDVPFDIDELKKESQQGKKAKKGVSLFATSQRRSYPTKHQRKALLDEFAGRYRDAHMFETTVDLDEDLGSSAGLYLSRIVSWLRLNCTDGDGLTQHIHAVAVFLRGHYVQEFVEV
ncbi:hypothetical protein DYB35_006354 [Aphanomyces astaci]|uniref:RING-type domain-containing protein n=1 Tax=Aphanomyces astaci TaxID=112090 RepID=A0A3R6XDJ9_APHAT|nr:hypothetical protein DYB35_006354 [Aphanomyces astaci]